MEIATCHQWIQGTYETCGHKNMGQGNFIGRHRKVYADIHLIYV